MTSLWQEGDVLSPTNLNTKIQSVITTSITTVVVPSINTANGVFAVKDYGALGNGVADDRASIQSAANAVAANGGGVLYFNPGTYLTSSQFYVPAGTVVQGAGRNVSIVRRKASTVTNGSGANTGAVLAWGPSDGTEYTAASRGSYGAVQDLTIDSGTQTLSSATPGAHGMRANFMNQLSCARVVFQNCYSSGAYLFGTRQSSFLACSALSNGRNPVADARNGFAITGPQDATVSQGSQDEHIFIACEAISNQDEGISVGRNGLVSFDGCIFKDNGDSGLEGDSGTQATDTTNVPAGISVANCYFSNNSNYGITLSNSNVQQYYIVNNSIDSHGKGGIGVSVNSLGRLLVIGNSIQTFGKLDATTHGITVSGDVRDIVIRDNIIGGGYTYGVVVIASALTRRITTGGNIIRSLVSGGGMSLTGRLMGSVGDDFIESCQGDAGVALNGGSLGGIQNFQVLGTTVRNSGTSAAPQPGIHIVANGTSDVSNIKVIAARATDDQAVKTQSYGVSLSTSSSGALLGVQLIACDLSGNSTGNVQSASTIFLSALPVESYSSASQFGLLTLTAPTQDRLAFNTTHRFFSQTTSSTVSHVSLNLHVNNAAAVSNAVSFSMLNTPGLEREYGRIASVVSSSASGAELGYLALFSITTGVLREVARANEFGQWSYGTDGLATVPATAFLSEQSLGLYRSATSTLALSYGTFNLRGGILSSIRSTNASATSATLNDGEFRVAAVSVTSAELAYRSGNTTYRFIAAATAL